MELQHTFTVPLPVEAAWEAFNDLPRIAPCLPGAEVTSMDGDDFTGLAKVRLGPISLHYTGTGRFLERDRDAYRAVIEASGKDRRGNGTASATITARLEPEGEGTRCVVDTDLRITGRPAQFGRGVISDVGDKLLGQFATCLSETLGAPAPAEAEQPAASPEQAEAREPVPSADQDAAQRAVAAQEPAAAQEFAVGGAAPGEPAAKPAPSTPPPRPLAPPATRRTSAELDLGSVVGPALVSRYGTTAVAVVVTAVVTWWLARRRHPRP
ncbi:SRPBCC family protein [Kineosporiaceae bacterium SCSIO 59966]|nr:SRPBCC family protein [Kineosporiaceae bacterium SCSIO 59966]